MLVTSRSFSSGDVDLLRELEDAGCDVRSGPPDHDLDTLAPLLASTVCWVAGTGPVTAAHLDAAADLRLVARYGVGVDAVDLDAARERGVLVTNTPGANTEAVADLTLALVLAALRDVVPGDRGVRAHAPRVSRGRELGSLTVGVVGFGRIGQAVARRLSGFGSRVLAHDPFLPADRVAAAGAEAVPLEDLVRASDVLTLHAPGDAVLVDEALLDRVRVGAVLVNAARAALVDERAVAGALRTGRLARYAADVLDDDGPDAPLLADDLVDVTILTPHAGAHTVQAVDAHGARCRRRRPRRPRRPDARPPGDRRRHHVTTTSEAGRDVLAALRETVVVAVLRAPSAQAAVSTVDALVAGGVTGIEVTYSTPEVPVVLREVLDRHPDVLLGAGTVVRPEHAEEAVGGRRRVPGQPGHACPTSPGRCWPRVRRCSPAR